MDNQLHRPPTSIGGLPNYGYRGYGRRGWAGKSNGRPLPYFEKRPPVSFYAI